MSDLSNEKKGFHSILKFSFIYNLVQKVLGSNRARSIFVKEYIRPIKNCRVLDFGSGTGSLFEELKNVEGLNYFGIEPNTKYVNDCKLLYKECDNAHFYNGSLETLHSMTENFDIIILSAVLHHLKTEFWNEVIEKLHSKLNYGGRLIILDIVFHEKQPLIAKTLVSLDRGISVLDVKEYLGLITSTYRLHYDIRTNLMRVPYSHIITTIFKA